MKKQFDFPGELLAKILGYVETQPKRRCRCDGCGRYEVPPYIKTDILRCASEFILGWEWEGYRSSSMREIREYIDRWGKCGGKYYIELSHIETNCDGNSTHSEDMGDDRMNSGDRVILQRKMSRIQPYEE